jgi:hypothetical protein
MVITVGAEETVAPKASVAEATSVMVLPCAAAAAAVTVKLLPTVVREPETLAGTATLPDPVAERLSCVTLVPAVFHPLATAVSDCPGCKVAPAGGAVMATWVAVMRMADDDTVGALMAVPELPSVPVAPLLAVKAPSDKAENGT